MRTSEEKKVGQVKKGVTGKSRLGAVLPPVPERGTNNLTPTKGDGAREEGKVGGTRRGPSFLGPFLVTYDATTNGPSRTRLNID